jgi:hypothetical protein
VNDEPFLCPAGFPVDPETKVCLRGDPGTKGDKGDRGAPGRGLPAGQRRAIVYLFLANFILTVIICAAFVRYVDSSQAAARRQGLVIEEKICATMGRLAANKPPAGNPVTNPSRGYDQRNHQILDQLGPDLGCR